MQVANDQLLQSTVLQCTRCVGLVACNARVSEVNVYKLGDNFFFGKHEPPTNEHQQSYSRTA